MRNVVPVALLLGLVLVGGTVRAAASAVPPSDAPNRSPGPALGPPALVTRELPATIRPVPTVPLLPSLIPAPSPALFPLGQPTATPTASPSATLSAEPSPLPTVARTPPPTPEPASAPPLVNEAP